MGAGCQVNHPCDSRGDCRNYYKGHMDKIGGGGGDGGGGGGRWVQLGRGGGKGRKGIQL